MQRRISLRRPFSTTVKRTVAIGLATVQLLGFGQPVVAMELSQVTAEAGHSTYVRWGREAKRLLRAAQRMTGFRTVRVNRTLPDVAPPDLNVHLSDSPTDAELSGLRFFGEPLRPVGRPTGQDENAALARALVTWRDDADRIGARSLREFLRDYPDSPWRASLMANLATISAGAGYYSRALAYWDQAWTLSKEDESPAGRAVADYAVGEWMSWAIRFGKEQAVGARLSEVAGRPFTGSAAERVRQAREGMQFLRNHHHMAMFSGPEALKALIRFRNPADAPSIQRVNEFHPTSKGTSLTELQVLAGTVGWDLRMEKRRVDATLPIPSIVHLRADHFSAVVRHEARGFLLRDPILGGEVWMSDAAMADEASGYVLVSTKVAVSGQLVGEDEGATVVGRCEPGHPSNDDPYWEWLFEYLFGRRKRLRGERNDGDDRGPHQGPNNSQNNEGNSGQPPEGGAGDNGDGPCGMPVYDFQPVSASLVIADVPVNCSTPRGPSIAFRLAYNHRDGRFPQSPTFGNVGARWTHNWLSYVTDNITSVLPPYTWTTVFLRSAGLEHYQTLGTVHQYTHAKLVKIANDPPRYERYLPDGSTEVFAQPDRAASLPLRRIFLTEVIDPTGQKIEFTYDSSFRLVAVEDALGRVTTLDYELGSDPLKLTKVTDPYGRTAELTYNSQGLLGSITDEIGMTSSFGYAADDFITSMTTPYGTTTFRHEPDAGSAQDYRSIEATDPSGATERLEFWFEHPTLASTAPTGEVPTGFSSYNVDQNKFVSLYWSPRAMMTGAGDASKANQVRWLYGASLGYQDHGVSRLPLMVKRPLESRVWFKYEGQTNGYSTGIGHRPIEAARVVDGSATQSWTGTYNDLGNPTSFTDPLGRQTTYTYATNQIDLTEVRQTGNGANDVLATYADYTSGHQPQTITDAAGEETTLTYNTAGQVLTVTNAKNETTTYAYDTDGFLTSVTGPVSGATTTLTYDDYGRVETITGSDGYAVTLAHDALGRVTSVTYPDETSDQVTYEKLHAKEQRDRLGRVTTLLHDAAGRLTAVRDPLGRTVQFDWCACGDLNALIDAKGQKTAWTRDLHGRVTLETRADGSTTTSYGYESLSGRLSTVTDPKSQVATYSYNLDDSLQQVAFSNATISTPTIGYTYDTKYPRLATMTDGVGTTTYSYVGVGSDGALALASVDGPYSSDTVTYSYDELGRVATRLLNSTGTAITYDALGRITDLDFPIGTFSYTFDGLTGRVASVTYPNDQTSTYTYLGHTGDHRLQTIHHKNPSAATLSKFDYTYDAVGNILTWRQERAGATTQVYTFTNDAVDQLTSAVLTDTNTTPTLLKRQAWAYDAAGNRTVEQTDDAVFQSSHDSLNRLSSRAAGGAIVVAGTLDEPAKVTIDGQPAVVDASNAFRGTAQISSGTTTVTLKAKDYSGNETTKQYEIDASGSTTSYSYDANGNLTGDGTKTFYWNALNQLVEVKEGTTTVATFEYDGAGRRAEKVAAGLTHTYIYDAEDIVEERTTGSNSDTIRYYHGAGIDEPLARKNGSDVITYYLADHLGSVVQETSSSGVVQLDREFDTWGRALQGASVSGYAFTGREWDAELELYYFRARYYSADVGRFLSEDSFGLGAGPNEYAYADNGVLQRVDPSGNDWKSATKNFAAGAVAGAAATIAVGVAAAAGTVVGGVVAAGAVGVGAYQSTISVQKIVTGKDPYTGRPLSGEERLDEVAGMAGAVVGGGAALRGGELKFGGIRVAPFGNRAGHPTGELPHYHRRVPDPFDPGNSLPGQGMRRHRPWDSRSTDSGFCSRF